MLVWPSSSHGRTCPPRACHAPICRPPVPARLLARTRPARRRRARPAGRPGPPRPRPRGHVVRPHRRGLGQTLPDRVAADLGRRPRGLEADRQGDPGVRQHGRRDRQRALRRRALPAAGHRQALRALRVRDRLGLPPQPARLRRERRAHRVPALRRRHLRRAHLDRAGAVRQVLRGHPRRTPPHHGRARPGRGLRRLLRLGHRLGVPDHRGRHRAARVPAARAAARRPLAGGEGRQQGRPRPRGGRGGLRRRRRGAQAKPDGGGGGARRGSADRPLAAGHLRLRPRAERDGAQGAGAEPGPGRRPADLRGAAGAAGRGRAGGSARGAGAHRPDRRQGAQAGRRAPRPGPALGRRRRRRLGRRPGRARGRRPGGGLGRAQVQARLRRRPGPRQAG